jgi:NADPH-dependent curcumin reductase CurA
LCGLVATYQGSGMHLPAATLMELVNRRVRMQGFIVLGRV